MKKESIDIVSEKEAKQQRPKRELRIEDVEINALYSAAYSMYLLIRDIEVRLNANNQSLGQRRKQVFNGMIRDIKGFKHKHDELDEDYIKSWAGDPKNVDAELSNSFAIVRLLVLWFDRVQGYEKREKQVLNYISHCFPTEVVTEQDLERFFAK